MEDCKPVNTPIVARGKPTESPPFEDQTLYMALVGSIMYLATVSRPDIAFAASQAGQRMTKPTMEDWTMAKRILRYIRGTTKFEIIYHRSEQPKVRKCEISGFLL